MLSVKPGVVTVGDKAEVPGHRLSSLYTVRFRQGFIRFGRRIAFAFEMMHARSVGDEEMSERGAQKLLPGMDALRDENC